MKKLLLCLCMVFFLFGYSTSIIINASDSSFKNIYTSGGNFLATTNDSKIYVWGDNSFGEGGVNSKNFIQTPTEITDNFNFSLGETAVFINLGSHNTSVITSDNRLFLWGQNYYGQIGDGTNTDKLLPIDISSLITLNPGETFIHIESDYGHTSVITSDGRIFMSGCNTAGELGDSTITSKYAFVETTSLYSLNSNEKIEFASLGNQFSVVYTNQNRVFAFGMNSFGKLGVGVFTNYARVTPVEITNGFGFNPGEDILSLSCSSENSLLLTSEGRVFSWGYNAYGQIGDGTTINKASPTNITSNFSLQPTDTITVISSGYMFNAAVSFEGDAFTWGYNAWDQLGIGNEVLDQSIPINITTNFNLNPNEKIIDIRTSNKNTYAKTDESRLFLWGSNDSYQLANGGWTSEPLPVEFSSPDFNKPIITAIDETINSSNASTWYPTFSANDDVDGDITNNVIVSFYEDDGISPLTLEASKEHLSACNHVIVKLDVSDNANNQAETITIHIDANDTSNPTIQLNGDSVIDLEYLEPYIEEGAAFSDNVDNIGDVLISGDTVNTSQLGSYTIHYDYTDTNGNIGTQVTRTVNVVDTTIPEIQLNGDEIITVEYLDTYLELGAIFNDNYDVSDDCDISGDIVDTSTLGSYTIYYDYTDTSSNAAEQVTRTIYVVDTTDPVIELNGDSDIYIEYQDTYLELGAIFNDNYDVSGDCDISGDIVDTSALGSYTIYYDYTDTSGNTAEQVTRTIYVVDTTDPVIELNGDSEIFVEYLDTYTELNAVWSDNLDGNGFALISGEIVNTLELGSYTIYYNYTDTSGNTAVQVSRTIYVVDTTNPVIELNGDSEIFVEYLDTYTELNAVWSDNFDSIGIAYVSGDVVNTSVLGTYIVYYNYTDTSGNIATQKIRTVNVIDTQCPVVDGIENGDTITLNRDLVIHFSDGSATLNGEVISDGATITNPGEYTLVVVDESGNTTTITFHVNTLFPSTFIIILILGFILLVGVIFITIKHVKKRKFKKDE